MYFVRHSFGYGKKVTNRIHQLIIAKDNGLSKKTLIGKLRTLEELKLLEIIPPDTYIKGGGSASCAYAPHFPKGYGYIHTIDDAKSLERYNKYIGKDKTQSREPEIVEKVKAPYKDMDF